MVKAGWTMTGLVALRPLGIRWKREAAEEEDGMRFSSTLQRFMTAPSDATANSASGFGPNR